MSPSSTYDILMKNMREAVSMSNKDGVIIHANTKFCELLGRKLSDIVGHSTLNFLDSQSQKIVQRKDDEERKRGKSSEYQMVLVSSTGEHIPVSVSGTPLPDGGTIGIMTDMRESLRQEKIYSQLIDHMGEAVCMTDKDGLASYVNPRLCSLLGRKYNDIVGKSAVDFLDSASKKKVIKIDKTERKQGISSSYDITIVTKLGNHIPVSLNGTPLPEGGTIGIMTDMREIQARKANEKILYNAVQYSTDGIIMCDPEGNINFWNKGAQLIFGSKHDDMMGKTLLKVFFKKDIQNILTDNEAVTRYNLTGKNHDGGKIQISLTQTPILSENKDKVVSYLLICRDVTHLKKIETDMESKYNKLKDAYDEIGILRRQSDYLFELLAIFENYHTDISTIGDFIVTSIIMLTQVDACELRVYNETNESFEIVSNFGFSQDWQGKKKVPFKGSMAEEIFTTKKSLKVIDILQEPRYKSPALARKQGLTSMLLIPLIAKGKPIGTLALYTKSDKKLEIFENEFIEKYAKIIELIVASSI